MSTEEIEYLKERNGSSYRDIIAETSIATFYYSRDTNLHESFPGSFHVLDRVRCEMFWEKYCYEGEDYRISESVVQNEGLKEFLLINEKCKRMQTDEDKLVIIDIITPVLRKVRNPKYFA